ncbi:MAG TPA: CPBP family intramembrane glutamic endopeptidase [Opitutaceae bacterium]|nr:CPBP family intramembrane glutamic endopeptidase [Opitutaceae bacterium]
MIPEHVTPVLAAAGTIELILIFAGIVVWWRMGRPRPPRLAPWSISVSDFLTCVLAVIGGGYFFQLLGHAIGDPFLRKFSAASDARTIVYGTAFQLGLLAGLAGARVYLRTRPEAAEVPTSPPRMPSLPVAGLVTFLAVLPAVTVTGLAWSWIIQLLGLPPEPQDLVDMFAHPQSRTSFIVLFVLATVGAPIVEELVFRAGLFRYLRTRLPRWAALSLPALFFASLHGNWASLGPIAMLAIIFSLAYERTGRIGVTMIAHGLFNLNTILLVLAGMRA